MLFKLLDYKYTGLLCMLVVIGYVSVSMFGADKQTFLPGKTTSAHHQVEQACDLCHTPLDGVKQDACLECHGEALKEVEDSHAPKVFNDPRSFSMLETIDAKRCVSCHAEHKDTQYAGKVATAPTDFCFACHDDIAQERPSHKDLSAEGCSASGCHNYHDNTALYEDFVKKHLDEEDTLVAAQLPLRNVAALHRKSLTAALTPLKIQDQDASVTVQDKLIIEQWAASQHADAAINCSDCHQVTSKESAQTVAEWNDQPNIDVCIECHAKEAETFFEGKHGMRIAAGLTAMSPASARIPMKSSAHDKQLSCHSCHAAHDYNTQKAAVEGCLACHDDTHSKAYKASPHYRLWQQELTGELAPGAGVSCASCHLPRTIIREKGADRVLVKHNQNANLRPNSKMIRDVCLRCHGLEFSLASLADTDLVLNNYAHAPVKGHKTIAMARDRLHKK